MATTYICGDSFATEDPDYKEFYNLWHEQLDTDVVNLASVCASNLLISLQVKRAIKNKADFIIVCFTSVTRSEVGYKSSSKNLKLFDRFYNLTRKDNSNCDMTAYTIFVPSDALALSSTQQELIIEYNKHFYDLDMSIYRDSQVIENTLQKLFDSKIPFIFDQGGFEHPSYGDNIKKYFKKFNYYKSDINLWDFVDTREHRPYFHIQDQTVHNRVAEYYNRTIKYAFENQSYSILGDK